MVSGLAVLYVVLLALGRSGLPLNAQWGDLLLPLLVLAVARDHPPRLWGRSGDGALALYLSVTLLAAALSAEPRVGLELFAKQLSGALILLVFRQLGDDGPLTGLLVRTFVLTFAALALASIVVVFLGGSSPIRPAWLGAVDVLPFLGRVWRLRGGFLTPEMLGNALVVALILALALRAGRGGKARWFWTAAATILVAGEFLTFSHSVAGFAVAAVLFLAPKLRSKALRSLAWSAAFSVVLVVNAASLVEPGPAVNDYGVGPVSFRFMGVEIRGELNHYAALKQVAWSAFLEHPLTGVGPGRFFRETERAFQEGRLNERYRNKPAQSDLLGRFAETGLFGGLSLLLLWASWLHSGASLSPSSILPRAAFAAVVGLLVNSINADVMNFRFLWLALAWTSASGPDLATAPSRE